jgi:hypothetical protein
MGPSPSAGMEVAIGSLRPSNVASLAIRDPILPPPMTMVSAFRLVDMRAAVVDETDEVNPWEVQIVARAKRDVSGE